MCAARPKRLPGFRFEAQAPVLPEVLPRMDIAVFVGFAASGPLQVPVAIESEAQFKAVFGDDAPLAWNVGRGEQHYAYLAPAVRAFFRNNGRRCWVIRVARQTASNNHDLNQARYNYFPIPGLARVEFDQAGNFTRVMPAFARARCQGSWSDSIRVSTALGSRLVRARGAIQQSGNEYKLLIERDASEPVSKGDLLQLDFDDNRLALTAVSGVRNVNVSPPSSVALLEVASTRSVWFQRVTQADVPAWVTKFAVRTFVKQANTSSLFPELSINWFSKAYLAEFAPESPAGTVTIRLSGCAASDAPQSGSIVRLSIPTFTFDRWWMTVDAVAFSPGGDGQVLLTGRPLWRIPPPASLPVTTPQCQCLGFEIWVRKEEEYSVGISDLGLDQAHERFWGQLPTDEEVYRETDAPSTDPPATILWNQVGDLFRFPLAGPERDENISDFYFPLSMPPLPEDYLGAVTLKGSALERDGLAEFNEDLFLDRGLVETQTMDLAGEAEYLMYLAPEPRRLNGIHAAFPLEEATIISVPDAVHRRWSRADDEPLAQPQPSSPPARPEWWQFLDCAPPSKPAKPALDNCEPQPPSPSPITGVHEPEWGNFLDCSIKVIEAPALSSSTNTSVDGTFTLSWNSSPPIDGAFILEESGDADFATPETVYSGGATSFTIYGRKPGDYFYRVRAFVAAQSSDWSNGVAVRVGEATRWITEDANGALPTDELSARTMLAVQRSLVRMCAARGDLVCLLSLPEHYREANALAHAGLLKATPEVTASISHVSPLSTGEALGFTYAALFHPWLIEREEDQADRLTRMPPCGAIAGLFADRALNRGAWIAPANQAMRGVIALAPPLNPSRRLDLQEARINLVRQEPHGFLVLDAETLSDDPDLVQMNVRRLLILLRRQALLLGAKYVFEPNSPAFRRSVDRGFTEMLDGMFERGAFAGATPASAYQVVTDASLNTPQSVEQGRFIVELRVAPSLPMTFMTIRLIQTSERSLATEVR